MTIEANNVQDIVAKLADICRDNELKLDAKFDVFPPRVRLSKDSEPGLFDQDEAEGNPAEMLIYFAGGEMFTRTRGVFLLDDKTFARLRGTVKKLHYAYLQHFHREKVIEDFAGLDDVTPSAEALQE